MTPAPVGGPREDRVFRDLGRVELAPCEDVGHAWKRLGHQLAAAGLPDELRRRSSYQPPSARRRRKAARAEARRRRAAKRQAEASGRRPVRSTMPGEWTPTSE
jgi:ribosomal protein S21